VLSKTSARDKGTRPRRLISSPCPCETRSCPRGGTVVPAGGSRTVRAGIGTTVYRAKMAGRTRPPGRRGRCPEGPYGPNRSSGAHSACDARKRVALERFHARARLMACEFFHPSTVRCVSRTTSPGQSMAVTKFVALGCGGKNLSHLLQGEH
jgi:hypothetical protein